ncbi:carboxypeptidase-like regulatory domain-containing protein [Solitalea lacus]|uniref:carboxypeptidase-like regulatory domain-containing protein n=1 Tax=Solitalea lacus TaxID=2911172 RepID=UPI001EDB5D17|nr:carboxypeptidase-like regulatory domain-containing protein [Solitalea lacus]UKJ06982.1 carboxypeptidase-like regulatory domain-containing protein [Solitalea lacus]
MKNIFYLLFTCVTATCFAQQQETHYILSGKIIDAKTTQPLSNVSIINRNKGIGTHSSLNGQFSIKGKPGDSIEVIFLGYERFIFKIQDSSNTTIRLQPKIIELNEVNVSTFKSYEAFKTAFLITTVASETVYSEVKKKNEPDEILAKSYNLNSDLINRAVNTPGKDFAPKEPDIIGIDLKYIQKYLQKVKANKKLKAKKAKSTN